ncbi:hypothetical protein AB6A40_000067 [Gnathostoma spinigerum]|uniref:Rac GTPase-activating protein 1 n=1 Tax=Gnathostoma spinigerum TaxID=75299 RepID=A0ABD6E1E9_9BILA
MHKCEPSSYTLAVVRNTEWLKGCLEALINDLNSRDQEILKILDGWQKSVEKINEVSGKAYLLQEEISQLKGKYKLSEERIKDLRCQLEHSLNRYQQLHKENEFLKVRLKAAENNTETSKKINPQRNEEFLSVDYSLESLETPPLKKLRRSLTPDISDGISKEIGSQAVIRCDSEKNDLEKAHLSQSALRRSVSQPQLVNGLDSYPVSRRHESESFETFSCANMDLDMITPPTRERITSNSQSECEEKNRSFRNNREISSKNVSGKTEGFARIGVSEESHFLSDYVRSRTHTFLRQPSLLREICDFCGTHITFASKLLRCSDCFATCHIMCRAVAHLPCVPRIKKPCYGRVRLRDFCSKTVPMIPHILIHAILEIEKRFIDQRGLYSNIRTDKKAADFLQRLKMERTLPRMIEYDSAAICAAMLKFLKELPEAIIPRTSIAECKEAIENQHTAQKLTLLVDDLPLPNLHTLAFLVLHIQMVLAHADKNGATLQMLAECFAYALVGKSDTVRCLRIDQVIAICKALINLESRYWNSVLSEADIENEKRREEPAAKTLTVVKLRSKVSGSGLRESLSLTRTPLNVRTPYRSRRAVQTPSLWH